MPSLQPAVGPALFVFICDKEPGEGRGDCLIPSVGEVREKPVKGTD